MTEPRSSEWQRAPHVAIGEKVLVKDVGRKASSKSRHSGDAAENRTCTGISAAQRSAGSGRGGSIDSNAPSDDVSFFCFACVRTNEGRKTYFEDGRRVKVLPSKKAAEHKPPSISSLASLGLLMPALDKHLTQKRLFGPPSPFPARRSITHPIPGHDNRQTPRPACWNCNLHLRNLNARVVFPIDLRCPLGNGPECYCVSLMLLWCRKGLGAWSSVIRIIRRAIFYLPLRHEAKVGRTMSS